MMATCLQTSVARPAVQPRTTQRAARSTSGLIRCSAQKKASNFVDARKTAALAAAASLLLAQSSFAGPLDKLDSMLPDSAPSVPNEQFERDLGEGRKLKVGQDSKKDNTSRVTRGGKGSPSDSADARSEPDVAVKGGGLPGISSKLAPDSTSAPISNR